MKFKVIKSSFDGICGDDPTYKDVDETLEQIATFKGWASLEELHGAIRRWAGVCRVGHIFFTQYSAIVCVGGKKKRTMSKLVGAAKSA